MNILTLIKSLVPYNLRHLYRLAYFIYKFTGTQFNLYRPPYISKHRANTYNFGKRVDLGIDAYLLGDYISIGDYTYLNSHVEIVACKKAPVTIGKFCSLANYVFIRSDANHPINYVSAYPFVDRTKDFISDKFYDAEIKLLPIHIGNDVWIGYRAIILPGVTIGDGAIIGAGAVVTKDVEPYTLVAGVPAKPIRKRFSNNIIKQLLEIKWWDWPIEKIKRNKKFFSTNLETFKGSLKNIIAD